jgi:hypothetical protein
VGGKWHVQRPEERSVIGKTQIYDGYEYKMIDGTLRRRKVQ